MNLEGNGKVVGVGEGRIVWKEAGGESNTKDVGKPYEIIYLKLNSMCIITIFIINSYVTWGDNDPLKTIDSLTKPSHKA